MEGIIVYLHVAQGGSVLDQAIERVRFAGGDILVPVTEIGPMGQFAVIRDREGKRRRRPGASLTSPRRFPRQIVSRRRTYSSKVRANK